MALGQAEKSSTETPAITTVIPTYRRPRLLRRAVASVLSQTRRDLTVLVCDNASGDETSSVVGELAKEDPRVRYSCQPENVGIARNFEAGMRAVQTPYFSCLADDDLLLPGFYQEAIDVLEREPSVMLFAATTILANFDGTLAGLTLKNWQPGKYDPPAGLYGMIRNGCPNWTSIVFRRELLSLVGFLDLDTGTAADDDFLLRIAARHSFIVSKKPGGVFFVNPESAGRRTCLTQLLSQRSKTMQNFSDLPEQYRAEALRLFEPNIVPRLFVHGRRAALEGDRAEALATARMLEKCAGPMPAAKIKLLVACDRLGLRNLVRFGATATRFVRNQGSLSALRKKRAYQEIIDRALNELREKFRADCVLNQ